MTAASGVVKESTDDVLEVSGELPPLRPPALQDVGVEELADLAVAALSSTKPVYGTQIHVSPREYTRRALQGLLTVLASLNGDGWNAKWSAFEQMSVETGRLGTLLTDGRPTWASYVPAAVARLVLLDVVRPSYSWMVRRKMPVWRDVCYARDPEAMGEFATTMEQLGSAPATQQNVVRIFGWILGRKGKLPREVTAEEVLELSSIMNRRYGNSKGAATLWRVLHKLGWLDDESPILPTKSRRQAPKSPTELVDRYRVASPQREVLIEYLTQRAPSMDYASLSNLSQKLVGRFWADVARHPPGSSRLRPDGRAGGGVEVSIVEEPERINPASPSRSVVHRQGVLP